MGEEATAALGGLTAGCLFHARYQVERCVGIGGMGAVYEALDLRTRRRRALKVMLPVIAADAELRGRFELEARITADIESDHIVETYDAGIDPETGAPFLVMEILRGEDLGTRLRKSGPLSPGETVTLLAQAALALDRTHAAGIVHRDLKPDNLFVASRDDASPRLVILDFGIAKLVAQSTQSFRTTRTVGTPAYMAPEQIQGDGGIAAPADLYAVTHIAYTLLVGEPYWSTEARARGALLPMLMKVSEGPKVRASVRAAPRGVALSAEFDTWFARGTALDPGDRFPSAGELVRELSRVLHVEPPTSLQPGTRRSAAGAAPGVARSLRLRGIVASAVLSLGAAVAALAALRASSHEAKPISETVSVTVVPAVSAPERAETMAPWDIVSSGDAPARVPIQRQESTHAAPAAAAGPRAGIVPPAPAGARRRTIAGDAGAAARSPATGASSSAVLAAPAAAKQEDPSDTR